MKFGHMLKVRKATLEMHIPADSFIDYDLLKEIINGGLHEMTDLDVWQKSFYHAYIDQVRLLRIFLEAEVKGTGKTPVPVQVLLLFVELNRVCHEGISTPTTVSRAPLAICAPHLIDQRSRPVCGRPASTRSRRSLTRWRPTTTCARSSARQD